MNESLPVFDPSALPRPVLPGHDDWLSLWSLAWRLLARRRLGADEPRRDPRPRGQRFRGPGAREIRL